jgi:hypothetical protein
MCIKLFVKKYLVFLIGTSIIVIGCKRHDKESNSLSTEKIIQDSALQRRNMTISRTSWGGALVHVSDSNGLWLLSGTKRKVSFNESNFVLNIHADSTDWEMVPSQPNDIIVRKKGNEREYQLSLANAGTKKVEYYDAGYKTGIKITLSNWKGFDLTLYLTICLEANTEDLLFTVAAKENQTVIQQLDWPTAMDGNQIDYTVLPSFWGILLPRNWPKPFNPVRPLDSSGKIPSTDHSILQSNLIEDWGMSWWGFEKGKSSMMVIVETPNDAGYQFNHPAGGPTIIGPRWRESLGELAYQRKLRMCFFSDGNYVNMAKRYRQYAKNTGLFVSLNEKITRSPIVKKLIGAPILRMSILVDVKKGSWQWEHRPSERHHLTTFDESAKQLEALKASGMNHLTVILTGWGHYGYDRQRPDILPPAPEAGGFEGMKRLVNLCKKLGYLVGVQSNFRDYYLDAPSYSPQFAIHEEFANTPPHAFPGSRFGDSKEGKIPFMDHWDGGKQTYLSGSFMVGEMKKNFLWLFDHDIHLQGSYLDVFGYVPPDEDFNPEHPVSRTEDIHYRSLCYTWTRNNLGFVGTEAGCDWTIPYVDFSAPEHSKAGIPAPLMQLVYHDAILTPYQPSDLRGFLYGGIPEVNISDLKNEKTVEMIRRMCKLNKRVALLEMTNDEFLDNNHQLERTTFSDGTTVTVNWNKNTVKISPELK